MSKSAFGVEHPTLISKRRKENRDITGSTIAGAGGTAAGVGLLGGGIPGVKSNADTIKNLHSGSAAQRIGAAMSSGRGGVFGYRTDAHVKALKRFENDVNYYKDKPATRPEMFMRGRTAGKIAPEKQIIRHMKTGRRASNALLVGGLGATAYGVKRVKDKKKIAKSQSDTDRYHGAMLGVGSAGAVSGFGLKRILSSQGKKWAQRADANAAQANKLVPNLSPTMSTDDAFEDGKRVFSGKNKKIAEEAGRLRGHATQQRYFSRVYRSTGKIAGKAGMASAGVAGVGAGGVLLSQRNKR